MTEQERIANVIGACPPWVWAAWFYVRGIDITVGRVRLR